MDFQNELKKRRMYAIKTENTTGLLGKVHEVADFIEVEILKSIGRHQFTGDRTVRFSYLPEMVVGLEHKSILYSPNFKAMTVGHKGYDAYDLNITYPKIDFPTDGIFLTNVANLLKLQKIDVKEINRERGYIVFEWSLDAQEYVTDSAKKDAPLDDLTPEERAKIEKEMDDQLWWMDRDGEL